MTFKKKFIRNSSQIEECVNKAIEDELAQIPPERRVKITYRNFQGKERLFEADNASIKTVGDRIFIRVAPDRKKFYLKKAQIQNLGEIEKFIQPEAK